MKERGGWPSSDYPSGVQYFRVAVLGAGAAAPVLPPGKTFSATDFHAKANAISRSAAEIPTRSGVGAYIITYDLAFKVPFIMNAPVEILGATGMWAQVSAVNPSTRQLTLKVFNAGGAATDLANGTDLLVIECECLDSNTANGGLG